MMMMSAHGYTSGSRAQPLKSRAAPFRARSRARSHRRRRSPVPLGASSSGDNNSPSGGGEPSSSSSSDASNNNPAAGGDASNNSNKLAKRMPAPLAPATPTGEYLSYVLTNEPHLFADAVESQLQQMQ
eukprot:133820_1